MADNIFTNNIALRKEFLEYGFPDQGIESINTQISRYVAQLNNIDMNHAYLDKPKEQIYQNKLTRHTFILRKDDTGKDTVLFRMIDVNGLSKYDQKFLLEEHHEVVLNIFHHTDLDGVTAAAITSKVFEYPFQISRNKKMRLHPYNYAGSKIFEVCSEMNRSIYKYYHKLAIILDLNMDSNTLNAIINSHDQVIYIDHHNKSLELCKQVNRVANKSFWCYIDLRYSTAYLCNVLFKNLVKKYHDIEINEALPNIVSMMDTKLNRKTIPEWIPITVSNEEILRSLNGRTIKLGIRSPTVKVDPKNTSLIGRNIFLKTKKISTQALSEGYVCGLKLNQYLKDMECLEAYPKFWDRLLSDTQSLSDVITIGGQLSELSMQKNKLLYENDVKFSAIYKGRTIKGIIGSSQSKFLGNNDYKWVRIVLRYTKSIDSISCSVYTEDAFLKKANLGNIMAKLAYNGGGHSGAAGGIVNTKQMYQIMNGNNNDPDIPDVKGMIQKIVFKIEPHNHLKFDNRMLDTFKVISAIIFSKWEECIQTSLKNKTSV